MILLSKYHSKNKIKLLTNLIPVTELRTQDYIFSCFVMVYHPVILTGAQCVGQCGDVGYADKSC